VTRWVGRFTEECVAGVVVDPAQDFDVGHRWPSCQVGEVRLGQRSVGLFGGKSGCRTIWAVLWGAGLHESGRRSDGG